MSTKKTAGLSVWSTVKIGSGSPIGLLEEIERLGQVRLRDGVRDLADKIAPSPAGEIDLVKIRVVDLGFPSGSGFNQACQTGLNSGLRLLPQATALYVALAVPDAVSEISLKPGDRIVFAMESLIDTGGRRWVFDLYHQPVKALLPYGLFELGIRFGNPGLGPEKIGDLGLFDHQLQPQEFVVFAQ